MSQFIFLLFYVVLLAVALTTGAFLLIVFSAVIAGVALFLWIYVKLTGRLPGGLRMYTFRQHTHYEEPENPQGIKVIEAEYEEVKK